MKTVDFPCSESNPPYLQSDVIRIIYSLGYILKLKEAFTYRRFLFQFYI